MNIYAAPGSRVIYLGTTDSQVTWGNHSDPRGVLVEGKEYIVSDVEIGDWSTDVILEGITGKFNAVCFEGAA